MSALRVVPQKQNCRDADVGYGSLLKEDVSRSSKKVDIGTESNFVEMKPL